MDMKEICKVFAKPYPELVPEKYYLALTTCGVMDFDNISWNKALGTKVYNALTETQEKKFEEIILDIGSDIDYYMQVYKKTMSVFDHLQPAKVDLIQYKVLMNSDSVSNDSKIILEKWKPDGQGFLPLPTYNLSSSVTGRMKIVSGPNALLLPKDLRKILKSRHGKEGSLWYLDFVSLEPRVALAIHKFLSSVGMLGDVPKQGAQTGLVSNSISNVSLSIVGYPPQLSELLEYKGNSLISPLPEDVYQDALKYLKLSSEIDRSMLKQIVLPQIYGQSKHNTIETMEKKNIRKPEEVVDMVNEFFGIDDLRQYVARDLQNNDCKYLRTFYGKHISPDDSRPYTLLNYYIQSLAVDVALLGFKSILDRVAKVPNASSLICPIFFIHDAMVLDVHSSMDHHLNSLMNLGSKNIPGFPEHKFHMSATKL